MQVCSKTTATICERSCFHAVDHIYALIAGGAYSELQNRVQEAMLQGVQASLPSEALPVPGDREGKALKEFVRDYSFSECVKSPTRGQYLLDLVLSNIKLSVSASVVPGISDHSSSSNEN